MSAMNWATRKQLYEQAAARLENGLSLTAILKDFAQSLQRRGKRRAAESVAQTFRLVRDGRSLASALGSGLTEVEKSVIAAGEKGGNAADGETNQLANAFRLILDMRARTDKIKGSFVLKLLGPCFLALVLWATLWSIGTMVIPQFASMVPVSKWTGWGYVMYVLGAVATGWTGVIAGTLFGVLAVAIVLSRPRWDGRWRVFADNHVFPFTVFRELDGLVWLMTFNALLDAGIADTEALKTQLETASPWLASRLRHLLVSLRDGKSLPDAMTRSGTGFPSPDLIEEISAYTGFKDFPVKMKRVSNEYADKLEKRLTVLAVVLSGVVQLLTYTLLGVVQMGANSLGTIAGNSLG